MNWRVKGIVQKVLSATPGGVQVNDWLQRTAGGLRNFDDHIAGKLEDYRIIVSHMEEAGVPVKGARCMEIGTGWIPVLPVCLLRDGAAQCITLDLNRHLDEKLTRRFAGNNEALAIDYRAPADATATGLPDNSVDVVFSNSVLEHVPREIILRMMQETRRILRPGGIAVHSVGCNDHYRHFDKTISPVNYLRYSDRQWRLWNNDLQYQNRLRPQDFLEIVRQAGLEIVMKKSNSIPEAIKDLPIADEFRRYSPEQLAAVSLDFVARKS